MLCQKIAVWRNRGNLPHPVDATALLMEAVLTDEKNILTDITMRLLYSSAYCRYESGYSRLIYVD